MSVSEMQGFVASGLEEVREAFEHNFDQYDELGAAFAAYHEGELVVDLWGGTADFTAGRPWQQDTLQLIFSGTKGLVAVCLLTLIERGVLELDRPVADYWPEFAANGKDLILVRDLAAHTARLPGVEAPLTLDDLTDDRSLAELLAAQAPSDDPRARLCYHALTYGWLCGELVRRVDGRSIGRYFADEVAGPLELELWIGLPAELEHRVARLEQHPSWPSTPFLDPEALERDPLVRAIWANPRFLDREDFPWNSRAYHAAEIAGANAIGNARSIARLYGRLEQLLAPETLLLGRTTLSEGMDEAYEEPRHFGVGFALQTERMPFGPPPEAFGHGGAGGSLHGAWPEQRVGFSYTMNLMRDDQEVDPRPTALLDALHRAIHG